jgi:hypothetical protein
VLVVDRFSAPEMAFDLALSDGWARDVRLPDVALGEFVLQGTDRRLGFLYLAGVRGEGHRQIEVSAPSVWLTEMGPYLGRAGLPYAFSGGMASVLSRVSLAGGAWSADTTLTLHEPRLSGDQEALTRSLGMPPESALAALRDQEGRVTLKLPLSATADAGRGLGETVASAVRDAVAGARRTPLPAAPIEIAFPPGRTVPGARGARQLATISDILAARPDVVVELSGATSSEDRRWLAEQAVTDRIEAPGGFRGVLRAIGVRNRETRIREALEARGAGDPGRLDPDDEAALDELVAAAPPVPDERVAALAAARVTYISNLLAGRHAVSTNRVVVGEAPDHERAAPPTVDARFVAGTVRPEAKAE